MTPPASFLRSTVGRKVVMAVTGIVLAGFVLGHMAGNLQIFLGAEAINAYGEFLREALHGAGLWMTRAGLLAALVAHVWAAVSVSLESRAARPIGYRRQDWRASTYASRTMIWSGPLIGLFVVYHLLHLTTGQAHGDFRPGDVYHNVVTGFRVLPVSIVYIAAQVALGLHLWHGAWSMLQTLGLSHPRWNRLRFGAAALFALLVTGGNILIPLAVLAGLVGAGV